RAPGAFVDGRPRIGRRSGVAVGASPRIEPALAGAGGVGAGADAAVTAAISGIAMPDLVRRRHSRRTVSAKTGRLPVIPVAHTAMPTRHVAGRAVGGQCRASDAREAAAGSRLVEKKPADAALNHRAGGGKRWRHGCLATATG